MEERLDLVMSPNRISVSTAH